MAIELLIEAAAADDRQERFEMPCITIGRDPTSVLRFDMAALSSNTGNLNAALFDAGSYIRLFYNTDSSRPKEGLEAVFFPLDTDRFRLGYLYDISWGGTAASINQSIFPRLNGSSPGAKVQYDFGEGIYVFGGFKTASITQIQTNLVPGEQAGNEVENVRVNETNYGLLTGFGADLGSLFHIDAGGGYFQQGRFEFADLRPPSKIGSVSIVPNSGPSTHVRLDQLKRFESSFDSKPAWPVRLSAGKNADFELTVKSVEATEAVGWAGGK